MVYLAGEWVPANLMMGIALLVAGLGVLGLGWWVVRGDRINRERGVEGIPEESPERAVLSEESGAAH